VKRGLILAAIAAFALAAKQPGTLPGVGVKFHALPAGKARPLVEASCFPCHSADIIVQQRLTEKQWAANIDKMIRWGAAMKESDKGEIIAYLAKHFGPENKSFTPIATRPIGR
jgi:hypothetical protein